MRRKIKLLIVEDNEDERLFMKEGFLQTGLYEIVGEAENGNEMLMLLNEASIPMPEVILSDLNMPGRNGFEVIMDVKTNTSLSHIPVIILTTAPLQPYAERCKNLGACAYYTKPDTFLEYKGFGEKIYPEIRECVEKTRLNYNGIKEHKRFFAQRILKTVRRAVSFFYQSIAFTGDCLRQHLTIYNLFRGTPRGLVSLLSIFSQSHQQRL